MAVSYWVLDDKRQPVRVEDALDFANWFTEHALETVVGLDEIGPVMVSTTFIGLSAASVMSDEPRGLFECKTFPDLGTAPDWLGREWHYDTWEEAANGHAVVVAMLRGQYPQPVLPPGGVRHSLN